MIAKIDQSISDKVHRLRNTVIIGSFIDMVPYTSEYDSEVVRLRSLEEVRYFMKLSEAPSVKAQVTWRSYYECRSDDIMWIMKDKLGRVCGTNRLYNISKYFCEKGSLVTDPTLTRTVPATLESEFIVINRAFDDFNIDAVVTHVRPDNVKMNSINNRFGFVRDGSVDIRGQEFFRYFLERKAWNPDPLKKVLDHWAKRFLPH
jgi:RimJ/RimL family protein N-acetyltransferase